MQGVWHGAAIVQESLHEFAGEEIAEDEDQPVLDLSHPAATHAHLAARHATRPPAVVRAGWSHGLMPCCVGQAGLHNISQWSAQAANKGSCTSLLGT